MVTSLLNDHATTAHIVQNLASWLCFLVQVYWYFYSSTDCQTFEKYFLIFFRKQLYLEGKLVPGLHCKKELGLVISFQDSVKQYLLPTDHASYFKHCNVGTKQQVLFTGMQIVACCIAKTGNVKSKEYSLLESVYHCVCGIWVLGKLSSST